MRLTVSYSVFLSISLSTVYLQDIDHTFCFSAANLGTKTIMTPLGPLQLTAEECNEILMKRALQAQGISTPSVIDASQLNHTLLNGTIKTINEAPPQQTETIQTNTIQQHHLLHTKQEPGTANNSPKVFFELLFFCTWHKSLSCPVHVYIIYIH